MGASEGIISGSFIVFGALFLSALFLGRGFCAWFCPLAGIQEASFLARDKNVANKYNWISLASGISGNYLDFSHYCLYKNKVFW